MEYIHVLLIEPRFPYGLKDVGTDVNGHSCNKITYELSSSEINESCVGQRIKIGKHDQLQSS